MQGFELAIQIVTTPTALKIQAWLGIDVRDNTKGQSINSLPMLESGILGIPTVITVNSEATPYPNGVRWLPSGGLGELSRRAAAAG